MLYGYKYISHDLDRLHEFLEHIVTDVWYNASGNFKLTKIDVKYRDLVKDINDDYLKIPIKTVFNIFKTLSNPDKIIIQNAFIQNNNIQGLCDGTITPIQYSEIKLLAGGGANGKTLANNIYILCTALYTQVPKLKPCYDSYGTLKERYDGFTQKHDINYCPFCGLNQMLREFHKPRNAYDHFFPKELYPFTAINFGNLIPMCDDCNSKYKSRQDPINLKYGGLTNRKKVFNPYNKSDYKFSFNLTISHNSTESLLPKHLTFKIKSTKYSDEKDTWENVFGIQERYKAVCCTPDKKDWLGQYKMMMSKFTHAEIMDRFSTNEYADHNFLKKSFLEECHKKGLI